MQRRRRSVREQYDWDCLIQSITRPQANVWDVAQLRKILRDGTQSIGGRNFCEQIDIPSAWGLVKYFVIRDCWRDIWTRPYVHKNILQ